MLIVWGKKTRRIAGGQAVDFCPVCRDVRVLRAVEVQLVGHLYYIPMGEGKAAAIELSCRHCGVTIGRDPRRCVVYSDSEINSLRKELLENPEPAIFARLDVERRLHRGKVSVEEREMLIAEPFLELEYLADSNLRTGSTESVTAVIALIFLALLASTVVVIVNQQPVSITGPLAGATVLFFLLTVYRAWRGYAMVARKHALLPLGSALRPLKPRREELEHVMAMLRSRGSDLAKNLSAEEVQRAIEMPG